MELEYRGSRIVIDVGKPLWAGWDEIVPLPSVPGLADGSDPSLAGVIISHPHLDHYGLIDQVHPSVPVYIGREASLLVGRGRVLQCRRGEAPSDRVSSITVCRSGWVPSRLRRTWPTTAASTRTHCWWRPAASGFSIPVTSGVTVARLACSRSCCSIHLGQSMCCCAKGPTSAPNLELMGIVAQKIRRATSPRSSSRWLSGCATPRGAVCVISSAQNIDRLVTVYRACRRAGRTLVTDLYTASIAQAIGRATIPQPGFPRYKVYVPNRQRMLVKTSGEFDRMELVRECRVFPEWLIEHAAEITFLQPSSAVSELLRAGVLGDGLAVWSMWPGYLEEMSGERLLRCLEAANVPLVIDHASGHASVADLKRLVTALRPEKVVPIHTEGGTRLSALFGEVSTWRDGEWRSV